MTDAVPAAAETAASSGGYRAASRHRRTGIVCTAVFLALGGVSAVGAWLNLDGSFQRPRLAAVMFGVFWDGFALLGLYLIALASRYRLFITDDAVRQVGVWRDRTLRFDAVRRLEWRRFPRGGSVKLRTDDEAMVVDFDPLKPPERTDVRRRLAAAVPEERQIGRVEFDRLFAEAEARRASSKPTSLVVPAAFLACGVAFVAAWWFGLGPQFLPVAAVNIVFGGYLLRPEPAA